MAPSVEGASPQIEGDHRVSCWQDGVGFDAEVVVKPIEHRFAFLEGEDRVGRSAASHHYRLVAE
jgi:hypothetical protein